MLIDKLVLHNLATDLGPEVLNTLIGVYIEDTISTIDNIKNALDTQNYDAIALEAHTLKSVSATYGAQDALVLAKSIDARCKEHVELALLTTDIKKLMQVLEDTVAEIKTINTQSLVAQ